MVKKTYYFLVIIAIIIVIFLLPKNMFTEDNIPTILIGNNDIEVEPIFKSKGIGSSGPWYPGYSAENTLKILNNTNSKVKVNNLGIDISLFRNDIKLETDNKDVMDYLDNMLIKIDYRNPLTRTFKGNIFEGTFKEFLNGVDTNLVLGKKDSINLIYTIKMDEKAESNIAGIVGKTDFTVNIQGDNKTSTTKRKKEEKYDDIDNHWAHDCIKTLLKHEIIKGYPDGTIKPNNYITRAETAVLVGNALDLEENNKFFSGYFDILPLWARGHIISTTEADVFKGYPGRLFKAYKNISREEMTSVLIRAFIEKEKTDIDIKFVDKKDISDWAIEDIKIAVDEKVIEGYPDNTFKPKENITRAEAFTIICKLLGYHDEHK